MRCPVCHKRYIAHPIDAGTYREHYCSKECEKEMERNIDLYEGAKNTEQLLQSD